MTVLISCFILCVWQFISVRSTGVSMALTSIAYKMTPSNPKSLSLSFSTNDGMESKITKNFEDFKTIKSSSSTKDEEVSTEYVSKSGSNSDNDSTLKELDFSKQKQNVEQNILCKVASSSQENVLGSRTNHSENHDVPRDLSNKKNTVNYKIKVLSPPAVYNNFPIYLPVSQNDAGSKLLSEAYTCSKNGPTSILPYPVRALAVGKQESTTAWQNVRKPFSNNEDTSKYKITEPLVNKSTINIAEHNVQKILNNIDVINVKEEIKPPVNTLCNHDIETNEINDIMSTFNDKKDKQTLKYYSVKNMSSKNPYASKETNFSDISPTLCKLSPPFLPDFSKPQQVYKSDYNTFDLRLGSSLDSTVSYVTPKFIFALSDVSATNAIPVLSGVSELCQPHNTIDAPIQLLETPVFISTSPELESHTCLSKPNVDVPIKDTNNATKKTISKSPVPYISSVTINYMPCIESSNEVMIFV